eukprot:maker-scaffold_1-snap-gene-28.32-mRNA-1 protein AED:0.00 eAED:0.00 QI:29/1/1/1/0/0/2/311/424
MDRFLQAFKEKYDAEDILGLGSLISLRASKTQDMQDLLTDIQGFPGAEEAGKAVVDKNLDVDEDFVALIKAHVSALYLLRKSEGGAKNILSAMDYQASKAESALSLFKSDPNYYRDLVDAVIIDTRKLAVLGQTVCNDEEGLKTAKRLFDSFFRATVVSHKLANFEDVNQFMVYSKLNTLQLSKNLIRAVNQKNFPGFESFPLSEKITYKYFVGKMCILRDDLTEARENLLYAWRRVRHDKSLLAQQTQILNLLVPVNLCLGYFPKTGSPVEQLVDKRLLKIAQLTRKGKVRSLEEYLEKSDTRAWLLEVGIYLLLDKLNVIAIRNLFYLVVRIHQADPNVVDKQKQRINLDKLVKAYKVYAFQEIEFETKVEPEDTLVLDEVRFWLSNLIHKNLLKAYIAFEKNIMVMSPSCPFPRPCEVDLE